jgi:hypothetical protein
MLDEADVCIRRRELPYTDDKGINLFGSTSVGFGGNRCVVPGPGTILRIKIPGQDIASRNLLCRVWIDDVSRQLKAVELSVRRLHRPMPHG